MSTIFLDPVTMDATAGAIGEHAQEIQTTTSTLESACSADVPLSLAGWLAEELHDIAVQAQMVALLYCLSALDTALRAQQIQADQSLVAAQPVFASPSVGTVGGFETTMTIGGPSDIGVVTGMPTGLTIAWIGGSSDLGIVPDGMPTAPTTAFIGGTPTYANDPLLAMASRLQNSNPGLSAQLLGVSSSVNESQYNGIKNILAPSGLSFVGSGTYEDHFGRSGGLAATYRDPRTGDLRF